MNSESVDLIATDPPFNKSKDFHSTPDKLGKGASFHDRWNWKDHVHTDWVEHLEVEMPALMEAIESGLNAHSSAMGAYLCYMSVRLLEMHRVLKPTGSIYLHCDPTASHYLKACMDAIFGRNQFRNEIIWSYQGTANPRRTFKRKHDNILFYAKDSRLSYFSDAGSSEPVSDFSKSKYTQEDERGRFKTIRHPDGTIHKQYIRETQRMRDVWEMPILNAMAKERTGYPTQKPLKLYERMIRASSQENDVVLDPFAGCATTCIAAERLGRQWVGIDLWEGAKDIVIRRMERQRTLVGAKLKRKGTSNGELFGVDFVFTSELPTRTDDGNTAAMALPPMVKFGKRAWERLSQGDMRARLLEVQQHPDVADRYLCAGCGRTLEAPFLEMDHISPKAADGVDTIDNRILLCRPCNLKKKHRYALSGLWDENKGDGWMQDVSAVQRASRMVKNLVKQVQHDLR